MHMDCLRSIPIVTAFCFTLASTVAAQPARLPPIESPVVHPDRTVTFSLHAPSAIKVELSGQFQSGNQPLQRDDVGNWSVTVGPVEPNLYPYCFVVDGVLVADPRNPDLFPNEGFKNSLLDVPGEKPSIHAVQDVPHGEVTHCYYPSKSLGVTRPLLVYTPPGYRADTEKYPTFYLISGTSDTEETWFRVGRANFILDNLIAQKRAVPMIVVMPYGNMRMGMPDPNSLKAAEMYKAFNDDLVGSIMPFVETHFRASPDREKRAIAGFSRGGGQSLFAGFSNLDKFAHVGSYSAYLTPEVVQKYFGEVVARPETTNRQLKLLWLGVGKSDFLYQPAVAFDKLMTEKQIEHRFLVTEGGHTWMNARHYLTETLQLYFR